MGVQRLVDKFIGDMTFGSENDVAAAQSRFSRLGIYCHIPFCASSCDFCAFYQERPRRSDIDRFLDAMEREFALEMAGGIRAHTIFWGGGTPGLLPERDLRRLGRGLKAHLTAEPEEWTVEMAPSTVKRSKLAALRDLGVTRISLGIQSFSEEWLARIGRIHTERQVREAIDRIREAQFPDWNIDLMFALPGQTIRDWQRELDHAIAAGPTHISTYCLTFEEDTALYLRMQQGAVERMSEEAEAGFYDETESRLRKAGYRQYEVSNFARPGHECRHNLDTWDMQEWIGFGPSAASQRGMNRYGNTPDLNAWMEGISLSRPDRVDHSHLKPAGLLIDAILFGLRKNRGVEIPSLATRFGVELPDALEATLEEWAELGLVRWDGKILGATRSGRRLVDHLGSCLLDLDPSPA